MQRVLCFLSLAFVGLSCGQNRPSNLRAMSQGVWQNAEVERLRNDPNTSHEMQSYFLTLDSECNTDKIRSVSNVPVHHDRPDSQTFTYYYEADLSHPNKPVVIYLPGGPGGHGIASEGHWMSGNYINIDHRGVHCNYGTERIFDLDAMTTWQTVRDIGYVIRQLGLKDFVIYGHSYGTVSATMLTHHLERDLGISPRAVVLEGTLGHGWPYFDAWYYDHTDQWQRLRNEYPKASLLFANGRLPPVGGTRLQWGSYLFNTGNAYVKMGEHLSELYDAVRVFEHSGVKGAVMKEVEESLKTQNTDLVVVPEYTLFTLQRIMCQDLTNEFRWRTTVLDPDGSMRLFPGTNSQNHCEQMPNHGMYDSKNYQLKAPLIYFQGETDPQTPYRQAYYHYTEQVESDGKEFILQERGSHAPSWSLDSCIDQIWSNILSSQAVRPLLNDKGYCKTPSKKNGGAQSAPSRGLPL